MSYIAESIKRLRKVRKLTQHDLGSILGVSREAISMYESGKRTPDIDKLYTLSKMSGMSIEEFCKLDEYEG